MLWLYGEILFPDNAILLPKKTDINTVGELVEQIARMNQGKYLDDTLTDAVPTIFAIGDGHGYPEKHYEAPNPGSVYLKTSSEK